jgi:hypothetical protein
VAPISKRNTCKSLSGAWNSDQPTISGQVKRYTLTIAGQRLVASSLISAEFDKPSIRAQARALTSTSFYCGFLLYIKIQTIAVTCRNHCWVITDLHRKPQGYCMFPIDSLQMVDFSSVTKQINQIKHSARGELPWNQPVKGLGSLGIIIEGKLKISNHEADCERHCPQKKEMLILI